MKQWIGLSKEESSGGFAVVRTEYILQILQSLQKDGGRVHKMVPIQLNDLYIGNIKIYSAPMIGIMQNEYDFGPSSTDQPGNCLDGLRWVHMTNGLMIFDNPETSFREQIEQIGSATK
ncbi:hypothetical protein [Chlorobium phaeovibrioides]|uniref:hypothetical protein n=1 Tax=Chlorobium phaeovibrioides TaxID=1094 RepID=UPI001CB8E0F5|nr:hypothetical protein [Chlorobium phaeovibrioides]